MAGGQSIRCQVVSSNDRSFRCTLAGRSGLSGRTRNDSVPSALPCGLRSKVNDAWPVPDTERRHLLRHLGRG